MAALEDQMRSLPPAAWGVIAGGAALGGLYWYRKREAAAAAAAAPAATTGTETDVSGLTDAQVLSAESGGGDAGTAASSAGTSTNLTTNLLWEAQGVGFATTQGYSPITSQSALEGYLNGLTLNSESQLIVNAVIARFGLPPEGVAGPIATTTTTVNPSPVAPPRMPTLPTPRPATPVAARPTVTPPRATAPAPPARYTIKSGDTLTGIAASHHVSEATLYSLNRTAIENTAKQHGHPNSGNGHWIYPGTVITL